MLKIKEIIQDKYFVINNRNAAIVNDKVKNFFETSNEILELDLKNNESVELDYIFLLEESVKCHIRGDFVELYKNNNKILEIIINSPYVSFIDQIDSKLRIRFSGINICFNIRLQSENFFNNRMVIPWQLDKIFRSHLDIRYMFQEATDERLSKSLLIVFSAMGKDYQFNYNYMESFKDIPVNKLFILDDFGKGGSYYLGKNRDFSIESSVMALIMHWTSSLNITPKDITTIGSSKGGYSALYYAIKYSFGNSLALAPSLYLGDFLYENYPGIMKYIYGDFNDGGRYYLNTLLERLVRVNRDSMPNIKIMVGTEDSRKDSHIIPFTNLLSSNQIHHELDIVKGVNHSELKLFAPEYFNYNLSMLYNLPPKPNIYFTKIELSTINNKEVKVQTSAIGEDLLYAYYWYLNDKLIEKVRYSKSKISSINILKNGYGRYRVRVFAKDKDGKMITKTSKSINILA